MALNWQDWIGRNRVVGAVKEQADPQAPLGVNKDPGKQDAQRHHQRNEHHEIGQSFIAFPSIGGQEERKMPGGPDDAQDHAGKQGMILAEQTGQGKATPAWPSLTRPDALSLVVVCNS